MSDAVVSAVSGSSSAPSISRGSALLIALLVVVALAALAFWPTAAWSPPRRPPLRAPIVFDEFVNPPSPAAASSSAPDPAAR